MPRAGDVTIRYDVDAHVYVAHCPLIGVYSQGETEAEAKEAIRSAVEMYLQYERERPG